MPSIPLHRFTGGALVYRPTADGYLLYSVGINEKDDGGRTAEEQAGCDDEELLAHCRRPGPHGGRCWALDPLCQLPSTAQSLSSSERSVVGLPAS